MFMTKKDIELTGDNRIARFEGLKFSKAAYEKLADKDISMLINIYSGRKSSDNNLLDCGIMEDKASKFRNKRFTLGCKLIEEPAQNNVGGLAFPSKKCLFNKNLTRVFVFLLQPPHLSGTKIDVLWKMPNL